MSSFETEVAVVGAGPYGLSVAAHLQERGVPFRILGEPMRTWLRMPPGLNLKSFGFATNIYVPRSDFTFSEYCRSRGLEDFEPCTMASFAQYGLWVQQHVIPEVEPLNVTEVRSVDGGFEVANAKGDRFRSRRVVVAVGLSYFARLPDWLRALPVELASHTGDHSGYATFQGKEVAVIGAGSSALEASTLLHEAGARPTLLVRGPGVEFHTRFDPNRSLWERFRHPISVLGPGRKSWVLEKVPMAAYYVPEARRVRFTRAYLGPAGSWWLRDRFEGKVPVLTRTKVVKAEEAGGRVRLLIHEGGGGERTLEVDHVVAGTGYEPDLDRLPFLDPGLRSRLDRVERTAALSRHFESSVPGLYFVGLASTFSFGPLLRFVCGAAYAAPTVARHIASRRPGSSRRDASGQPAARSARRWPASSP